MSSEDSERRRRRRLPGPAHSGARTGRRGGPGPTGRSPSASGTNTATREMLHRTEDRFRGQVEQCRRGHHRCTRIGVVLKNPLDTLLAKYKDKSGAELATATEKVQAAMTSIGNTPLRRYMRLAMPRRIIDQGSDTGRQGQHRQDQLGKVYIPGSCPSWAPPCLVGGLLMGGSPPPWEERKTEMPEASEEQ